MKSVIVKFTLTVLAFTAVLDAAAGDKDTVRAEDYFIEGVRAYCAKEYPDAEARLSRCLSMDPGNDAAMYYLAMISLNRNETDRAMDLLDRASVLDPGNPWYRLAMARLYSGINETDLAVSIYESLISDYPSRAATTTN